MIHKFLRSWLEIDSKALAHNVRLFRKIAGKASLMAVVKSNAYGHGLIESATFFEKQKVDWLGVDDLDEALTLRAAGITKPILVLGYTLPARFAEGATNNISITIASLDSLHAATKLKKGMGPKLKLHLKLETGLNRQGITQDELAALITIPTFPQMAEWLEFEGVYSHFAAAEMAKVSKYKKYCELQMRRFETMAHILEKVAGKKLIQHMSGTAATILLPQARYDLVRVGIGMYGLDPTSALTLPLVKKAKLKPALSWHAIIAQIKNVKRRERVGYDLTEQVKRDSKIAIVPVGYWHGYPRSLSNKGEVLVRGKRCRVLGRISMDMITIDVTDIKNAKAGEEVILIGKQDRENLSAEEVAAKAGTINYELVTRINPTLKRFYK